MTIVCRPIGRGNWRPLVLEWRHGLLLMKVGDTFSFNGALWRIAELKP